MSEFVNTKDVIGNQNTLDAILNNSITSFADEDITVVRNYAFHSNTLLTSVDVPNVTTVRGSAFDTCKYLDTFKADKMYHAEAYGFANAHVPSLVFKQNPSNTQLGSRLANYYTCYVFDHTVPAKATQINGEAYRYLFECFHLIIRGTQELTIGTPASFLQYSPIQYGYGWLYVDDNLVNTYKATTNWSAFADRIVGISKYPKDITEGTITDSWDAIFEAEEDGTYSTKYSVGDTKFLWINGRPILMEIVAMDTDVLSDDSGNAKITWMTYGTQVPERFNPVTKSTAGGWEESWIRQYIKTKYYDNIPTNVKSQIKQVKKYSCCQEPEGSRVKNVLSNDYIWIPSSQEVGLSSSTSYETSGVVYTYMSPSNATRKRSPNANPHDEASLSLAGYNYMLRTITSGTGSLLTVHYTGQSFGSTVTSYVGILFGFCT